MALSPQNLKARLQHRKNTFREFLKEHQAQRLILTGVQHQLTEEDVKQQRRSKVLKPWISQMGCLCLLHQDGKYRKIGFDYLKQKISYAIHMEYPARLEELYADGRINLRCSDLGNLLWMPKKLTRKNNTPHVNGVRYGFPKRMEWQGREVEIHPDHAAFLLLSPQYALLITDFWDWTQRETCFLLPLLTDYERTVVPKDSRNYWSLKAQPTVARLLAWDSFLNGWQSLHTPLPPFSIKQLSVTYRNFIDQANVRLQGLALEDQLIVLATFWNLSEPDQKRFFQAIQSAPAENNYLDFCKQWS